MGSFSTESKRKVLHRFSLAMIILVALLSYFISDAHLHQTWMGAENLGWLTVCQFILMTFFMLVAWRSAPNAKRLKDVYLLLIVAIIARLLLIPVEPYTSTDTDRYLFDGKIALSGFDPYRVNHNEPALSELKKQWAPPEEHAKYPTLYPPLSLGLFTLVAASGADHAPHLWKLVTTFAGISTLLILAILLKNLGRLRHLSLVAFSPLLILESGIGVHIDSISTLLVSLALYSFSKNKIATSGFFIGLGTLTKILPLMLLLPLVFGLKKIADSFRLSIATVLTIFAGYMITITFGLIPVGSIGTLFEKWRFGSPLFNLFENIAEGKELLLITFFALSAGCSFIFYRTLKLEKRIDVLSPLLPWSLAVVLLVSPVVFPWYLMVLVPFAALSPRPFMLAWVSVLPLTYEVLGGFVSAGSWSPANWPLVLISITLLISIYFESRRKLDWQAINKMLFRSQASINRRSGNAMTREKY
ncbi:DUF2029 domain-containing protein [Aliikangiella coralliicola]|uniref:DUF2029 domain-containing protein n=1 Tax=Aliikangiella coralliicola TaxID=2592383 RepID=A0A545UF82_9GAMM|nr:DUF2029 domain-containing protein [Aliikangiella coralliicola]TQV88124.1 DUF2029 domain-containing protein [Aliikangiella coralliicola]